MKAYWGRRIASSLLVLAVVLVLNFFLFRILPGDPVSAIIDPRFSPQAKEELAALFGLDRPLGEQFLLYVKQMLTFNFGVSFLSQRPVWDEIRSRLPNTLILLSSAMAISALLGIYLGVIAAAKRGGFIERLVLWAGAISFSFPSF
ncbi:MAG TPA: ABC transporter permease, partial [Thermosynergistes sp.]|nr:ABC transporter permease [Thermosynergistes sp.]